MLMRFIQGKALIVYSAYRDVSGVITHGAVKPVLLFAPLQTAFAVIGLGLFYTVLSPIN